MSLVIRVDESKLPRVTVSLSGKLDAMTYLEFDRSLDGVLARVPARGTLVLDLADLEYVSSAGLRSLFRARKTMKAAGGHSLIVNTQPQVQKVFEIVKAVPVNEIFRNTAELDAYLDAMQKKVISGEEED
jgi:sigma-B regulation protein RsbU (phosphoserine phosphatase)